MLTDKQMTTLRKLAVRLRELKPYLDRISAEVDEERTLLPERLWRGEIDDEASTISWLSTLPLSRSTMLSAISPRSRARTRLLGRAVSRRHSQTSYPPTKRSTCIVEWRRPQFASAEQLESRNENLPRRIYPRNETNRQRRA